VEIVSEPELRSAADAGTYLRRMKQILEYADVSDANMEEGSLRVDVNISVRPHGSTTLGTRTEIKNLNTFSGVERSIEVEFARQCAVIDSGGEILQQTMLWDGARGQIRPARSKEGSHDYRYFPEPDLPPLVLDAAWIGEQRDALPELPADKRARFRDVYGLTLAEVEQLTATQELADAYEAIATAAGDARRAANWVTGPLLASVNASDAPLRAHPVSAARLGALIKLEATNQISNTAARQLFTIMEHDSGEPLALATREGLLKVSDDTSLVGWIDEVLAEMPVEAARFFAGETKLQGVLVGQVMKKSKGAADPRKVNQLLSERAG
jgi:aspartyl-tRNA(Asn)/glutamyl-tRNA(Gln) amidotransferase subunit B